MAVQDPNNPQNPQSPIEPGQFVTTGEGGVFKEPPLPQTPNFPAPETAQGTPNSFPPPPAPAPSAPQPGLQFAQSMPTTTPQPETQPTPTPYVAPQTANQAPSTPPSTISKLKKLLIILGFLLLIVLIGALAWFFVLGKGQSPTRNITSQEPSSAPVTQTSPPPPARTTGGFSELPPATGEAEATPSGQ